MNERTDRAILDLRRALLLKLYELEQQVRRRVWAVAHEDTAAEPGIDQLREHIAAIKLALNWIDAGGYGWCMDCGRLIDPERLACKPETVRCLPCQRTAERVAASAHSWQLGLAQIRQRRGGRHEHLDS